MFDRMKQFIEMKKQADRIKKELSAASVDIEETPGIRIKITGDQTFQSVEISEELLQPANREKLQPALLRSLNAAI